VHRGLGAISLAAFAVALSTLIHVNPPGGLQSRLRGRERILQSFDFLRNDPRLVSLESGVNERDTNKGKQRSEKDFARLEFGLRVRGHGDQENSRTFSMATKDREKGGDRSSWEKTSGGTKDEPDELGIEEEDGSGDDPGNHRGDSRIYEFPHLGTIARKLDQRNNRERQLKAQNHLTENE
jgi:hypothetical protein